MTYLYVFVELNKLQNFISHGKVAQIVDNSTKLLWAQQITRLRTQASPLVAKAPRCKRAILWFLAPLLHGILDISTEDEVRQCQQAIEENRKSSQQITHKVNKMITFVNHSRHLIHENQEKVNELLEVTQDLIANANSLIYRVNRLVLTNKVNNVLTNLQALADHYFHAK